ncbi:MAG: hypothetical protein AAGE86_14640 [Pseudomonadota bacterium]
MTTHPIPDHCSNLVRLFLEKQSIRARDIRCLRQKVFGYAIDTAEKAELLFTIHRSLDQKSDEWRAFFVEALTEFVVYQSPPHRHVSPQNAVWLVEHVLTDGEVATATELEAVIRTLEKARSAPTLLAALPLMQVRRAIRGGQGAAMTLAGDNADDTQGTVNGAYVRLLSKILKAAQCDERLGISRDEAAILLDIHDDTRDADNAPEWDVLFVNAIDNALRFASGEEVASRSESLSHATSLKLSDGVDDFFRRMVRAISAGWIESADDTAWWQQRLQRASVPIQRTAMRADDLATSTETPDLTRTVDSRAERAVISFVSSEPAPADAPLMALVDDVPLAVDQPERAAQAA